MAGIPANRVVAVVADLDTGYRQIGSGYLLGARLVLTARHCTHDTATGRPATALRVMRASDGASVEVTLGAAAPSLDLVVLTAVGDPQWAADDVFDRVTFGRVDRDQSGVLDDCEAVGFPLWQQSELGSYRDLAEVHGSIYALEGRESQRLVMRDPTLTGVGWARMADAPDLDGPASQAAWNGLSGAAVFQGGLLLGVVIEHHPRQGPTAVQIRPMDAVAAAGDPDSARLGEVLGLGDPDVFRPATTRSGTSDQTLSPARPQWSRAVSGAAARLAGQLVAPPAVTALLASADKRAMARLIERALATALAELVSGADPDAAAILIAGAESVLGGYFADAEVALAVVETTLAGAGRPIGDLIAPFGDERGGDAEPLGFDIPALLTAVGDGLASEVRAEAARPQSPLFNLFMVGHAGLVETALAGSAPARVIGTAPAPPDLVIGRDDDLRRLRGRIGASGQLGNGAGEGARLQVITAVRGWPGVGKTTLAAKLVHDPAVARAFPHGVLWARLGRPGRVSSELSGWLASVGVDAGRDASVEYMSSRLSASLRGRRMLLVVDDVWDPRDAVPFLVGGPGSAMVVTTRGRAVAEEVVSTADQVYLLDVLDQQSSIQVLTELAPQVAASHPEAIGRLASTVEGLPLALQVAGRLLAAEAGRGLPVDTVLDQIADGVRLLSQRTPARLAAIVEESSPTMAAVFDRSVASLDGSDQLRFAYLGAFAPKPAMFTTDQIAAVWAALGDAATDVQDGIRTLVDRGLLETVAPACFQMHALLAIYADALLG